MLLLPEALIMTPEDVELPGSGWDPTGWVDAAAGYSQARLSPPMSPTQDVKVVQHPVPMPVAEYYHNMGRPPQYAAGFPSMPLTPQTALWPSMIASQNNQQPRHAPILPAPSTHTPVLLSSEVAARWTGAQKATERRKLTDEERRQMCLDAEENPSMKQSQIAGMSSHS